MHENTRSNHVSTRALAVILAQTCVCELQMFLWAQLLAVLLPCRGSGSQGSSTRFTQLIAFWHGLLRFDFLVKDA